MKKFVITHKPLIWLFGILILGLFLMLYFGKYDLYLYQDETMSYTGANNPDGLYYTVDSNTWYTGEDFLRPLTAQFGHLFDYEMVWRNQASDTHPPLYHVLLHTICSFFPEQFSKWFGMSLNVAAMLLAAFLTYKAALLLFHQNWILALCGAVAYVASISTITQVMFLRMYVVLQIFTAAVLLLHLRGIAEQSENKWKFSILLYLVTVLGTLTQYYYLIYAFFLAAGFCIYLLFCKKWKAVLKYVVTMVLSGVTVLAIFPAILTHLFHKEVGEIAVDNALNLPDIRLRIATMFGAVSEQIFGNRLKLFIAIMIIFCLVHVIKGIRAKRMKFMMENIKSQVGCRWGISWILCIETAMFYFLIVSLITPYLCERYLSPIFLIVILLLVGIAYYVLQDILKSAILPYCLVVVLALTPMVLKINGGLEDTAKMEMLSKAEEYSDVPCVIFDDIVTTENFMELCKYQKLYYLYDSPETASIPIQDAIVENAESLVAYIPKDADVEQYMQRLYQCNSNLKEYERLYVGYGTIAYLVK